MEELYEKILRMREAQEAEAGPFFAELSTPETWLELLRWMLENPTNNFEGQMTEVAAMALWALQAKEEAAELEASLETMESSLIQFPVMAGRFGPLDRQLAHFRSRKY